MSSLNENKVSLVIPMFNEGLNVAPLLQEIHHQLCRIQTQTEIVVVDDGSIDNTYQELQKLATELPNLTIIRHRNNYGQSSAIHSGVLHAQHGWIVTLDGDGQNDPQDIAALLKIALDQPDSVPILITGRRIKRNDSLVRNCSAKIAYLFRNGLLRDGCHDTGCGLKIFRREDFLRLPHFNHCHRFLPALFLRSGGKIISVPVNHRQRLRGISKYGIYNRLWTGIVDTLGMMWLQRRKLLVDIQKIERSNAVS